jgi:DNA-binding PadR family transcriptional regulator
MDARIKNRKRLRGYILKALHLFYPSPALVESLQTSMLATYIPESVDIKPYLHYLADRGYIEIKKTSTDFGLPLTHVKLTSRGVDVLEGTITDPGVILDGGTE